MGGRDEVVGAVAHGDGRGVGVARLELGAPVDLAVVAPHAADEGPRLRKGGAVAHHALPAVARGQASTGWRSSWANAAANAHVRRLLDAAGLGVALSAGGAVLILTAAPDTGDGDKKNPGARLSYLQPK